MSYTIIQAKQVKDLIDEGLHNYAIQKRLKLNQKAVEAIRTHYRQFQAESGIKWEPSPEQRVKAQISAHNWLRKQMA